MIKPANYFSEGPWRVRATMPVNSNDLVVVDRADKVVAQIAASKGAPQCQANATLVRAAPELLEALEFLLADYTAIDGAARTQSEVPERKARKAIARARGGR